MRFLGIRIPMGHTSVIHRQQRIVVREIVNPRLAFCHHTFTILLLSFGSGSGARFWWRGPGRRGTLKVCRWLIPGVVTIQLIRFGLVGNFRHTKSFRGCMGLGTCGASPNEGGIVGFHIVRITGRHIAYKSTYSQVKIAVVGGVLYSVARTYLYLKLF